MQTETYGRETKLSHIMKFRRRKFPEKGFSGASTREIARRALVTPVTFFRTFNSKEELHAEAVDYLIGSLQIRKQIAAMHRGNS